MSTISRRRFIGSGSLAMGALTWNGMRGQPAWGAMGAEGQASAPAELLEEFGYGDVLMTSDLHESQMMETHAVLMALDEDSLLRPFRQMAGMAAPGEDLGGWYRYNADYDYQKAFDDGFAPGCTFGQWVSALARMYAITGDEATRQKVWRLNRLYAETISGALYDKSRFPGYTYDKLLLGLLDSHVYTQDPQALAIVERTTDAAVEHLPGHAVEHDVAWRKDKDKTDRSWAWDETYTMPENLFLAYRKGLGQRYFDMAIGYLDDKAWFDPLARNENVFDGRHAYSYVNSLSSAMMAYMVAGSEKHLRAARNAFDMLAEQSFVTGGWGPNETLAAPNSDALYASLTSSHHSFETPCGAYAHFKLTRYLLRVSRDARYGDSMERMMYNTVLGAKPLQDNGLTFYYSDYNYNSKRVYKEARWPCCAGTLPQVAADYRINTYFRGRRAVYVNLYVPSTLRWIENGATLSLTQDSDYPHESHIRFAMTSSVPTELTLSFRIPQWAEGASLSVNGRRADTEVVPGQFAAIRRTWSDGDRVELELPLKMRLETIDERNTNTVALLSGPVVLMAVKARQDDPLPKVTRAQLLAARRMSRREWRVAATDGPVTMLPFTSLGERPYTTYLQVS